MVKVSEQVMHPEHVQFAHSLNNVPIGVGLADADAIRDELKDMFDVLLGRTEAPINSPYLGLMEVASAYYGRAKEIEALLLEAEREGEIIRGSDLYRVRTGILRSFIDCAKMCADTGSRRLTQEQLLTEQRLSQ